MKRPVTFDPLATLGGRRRRLADVEYLMTAVGLGRSMDSAARPTALDWYATMPAPCLASHDEAGDFSLRRYTGTSAEMQQPALEESILCMHLGGPKRVRRWRDGRMSVHDVELGSLTILPARQDNRWLTTGPIDFAHLTLTDALIEKVLIEEVGIAPSTAALGDWIGLRDPYLETLFRELLRTIQADGDGGRLYRDSLLVVLATALIHRHGPGVEHTPAVAKGGLAGWRLRRVLDCMQADLAADVSLDDLSALAGLSRAQFFRAFRQSTGCSPHLFRSNLRLEKARALLDGTTLGLDDILPLAGLREGAHFTSRFRERFGVTPRRYRAARA